MYIWYINILYDMECILSIISGFVNTKIKYDCEIRMLIK